MSPLNGRKKKNFVRIYCPIFHIINNHDGIINDRGKRCNIYPFPCQVFEVCLFLPRAFKRRDRNLSQIPRYIRLVEFVRRYGRRTKLLRYLSGPVTYLTANQVACQNCKTLVRVRFHTPYVKSIRDTRLFFVLFFLVQSISIRKNIFIYTIFNRLLFKWIPPSVELTWVEGSALALMPKNRGNRDKVIWRPANIRTGVFIVSRAHFSRSISHPVDSHWTNATIVSSTLNVIEIFAIKCIHVSFIVGI